MYKKMVIAMICNTLSDFFNEPIVESEIYDFEYNNETKIVRFVVKFWTTHGFEKHNGFICSTGRMNLDGNYLKGSYNKKQY